jgi:hypothetical protein
MTWIKDNKFLVTLGAVTLLGVIGLVVFGMKGASRYEAAKEEFDLAASEAASYERQPLYPRDENRQGKSKAIEDYKAATAELQQAFKPYRPEKLENISPQAFTDRLKQVNDELTAAFTEAGVEVPEEFFSGFERYRTTLANNNATGILKYQLEAIRFMMLALAESGASGLRNLHRAPLPEEAGREWKPAGNQMQVARALPLEITFVGPEKAARQFVSTLVDTDPYFTVIRTIRVTNTNQKPPVASDAKFDRPAAAGAAAPASAPFESIFGDAFTVPETEAEAEEAPAPAPAPPPAPAADSSRILAQVLGNEEVQVFVRLDLMQFLPAKKLP